MVANTRELLPEPGAPVTTVSRRFGISTLTSLRLFTRAPYTRIRSWLSALWTAGDPGSVLVAVLTVPPGPSGLDAHRVSRLIVSGGVGGPTEGSPQLLDADQVARGIAEGAVAHPVGLLGRL